MLFCGDFNYKQSADRNTAKDEIISLKDIPDYSGSAFIEINGNEPYFSDDDYTTSSLNTMRI